MYLYSTLQVVKYKRGSSRRGIRGKTRKEVREPQIASK